MIQYGFFVVILISSLLSTFVFCHFLHSKDFIRKMLFFFNSHYFILSLIKLKLEGAGLTLYQSFWEANIKTYLHYGIPLCLVALVTPCAAFFVFKRKTEKLVNWHVSLSIITYGIMHLLFGKITNACMVVLYITTFFISLIVSLLSHREMVFLSSDHASKVVKNNWPILALPSFLILFYYPNELYLTNISEFYNSYFSFLFILIFATLLVTVVITFYICLLPISWINYCINMVFAISICGYLQAMFFNGKIQAMIGVHQEWDWFKFIINAIMWLCIIFALILIGCKSSKLMVVERFASMFIMAMLFVTTITLFVQNYRGMDKTSGELTCEGDLILGDKNVVVFVLDMYDIRYFEEIITNNPEFSEPLNDFTLYDEAIARHPYTAISIPYMLTGTKWQEDESTQFQSYAYLGNTLLARLSTAGIDLGVYTSKLHFNESEYNKIRNYRDNIVRESDITNTISVMAKASLYKMMPFVCKENYFYYTGDVEKMVKQGIVWSIDNDIPFYERISNNGIVVDDMLDSTFRFYHMRGEHWPFYLSEEVCVDETLTQANSMTQAKGCMNIVYKYIEELKRKGIYDNTTIIITADHGDIISYDSETGKMSDYSMPIMFVKRAGECGDRLKINHAEVSHTELISTILDEYGLDYSDYGLRLEDVPEDAVRERYFGYYTESEGVVTGKVVGSGRDIDNWIVD